MKTNPIDPTRITPKAMRRFSSKYVADPATGCWVWIAGDDGSCGYGRFHFEKGHVKAHRFSYVAHTGTDIPPGLVLDHLCRNRACVNPNHLEAVTQSVNTSRGEVPEVNKRRARAVTHCPAGHPYEGDNLYITKTGKRQCKICKRDALVRFKARRAA